MQPTAPTAHRPARGQELALLVLAGLALLLVAAGTGLAVTLA